MSPIKEVQERYRELGRLRMGEQDGKRPKRLDTWRLTSPSKTLLEQAAGLWGGDVEVWEGAPTEGEQFELVTEVAALPVLVPPQDIEASTWLELWSAGGRKWMCDGVTDQLSGKPCVCATKETRDCKPTTQVKVILPDIPDMGTWRLVTHGWNAAAELTQTVKMLNWIGPNTLHDATFRIEGRTSKSENAQGKPETHHFVVPVLELPFTFAELISHAPVELTAGRGGRVGLPGAAPALPEDSRFEHDRETDWGAPAALPENSGSEEYGEGSIGPEPTSSDGDSDGTTVIASQPSEGSMSTEEPGATSDAPVSEPAPPLDDDEPAPIAQWKVATTHGITGPKALKACQALFKDNPPRSQSDITKRQLAAVIEAVLKK